MADALVIKGDVVQSFINDCNRGISMLSSSKTFTERMAEAAGPNGGLKQALSNVEDSWSIRREKLLDSFEKLMETISGLRAKYEDLDDEMAKLLDRRDEGGSTDPGSTNPGTAEPSAPLTPNPEGGQALPATPGGGGGAAVPPLGGSGGGAGGAAPQTGGMTPPTPVDFPPLRPDASDLQPPASLDDASSPLDSILAFAGRWAQLTGRSQEEVIALLVAGMGATGLIPAAILAQLARRPGTTIPGEILEDGPQPGQSGELLPGQGGDDPGHTSDPADDAAPECAVDAADQNLLTDAEATDTDAVPVEDSDEPGGGPDQSTSPSDGGDPAGPEEPAAEAVLPEAAADLQPDAPAAELPEPLDLPDLEPTSDQGGGSGGGASAGGGGVDLPPLADATDAATGGGGASAPIDLPDLTVAEPSAPAGAAGASADLPDLTVAAPAAESVGAAAIAAPMMRGVGGLGAVGGGASVGVPVPATTPQGGGVAREAQDDAAREVMEANEEDVR